MDRRPSESAAARAARAADEKPRVSTGRRRRAVVGAAIGIALWAIGYAFGLVPALLLGSNGLWLVLILGAIVGATRFDWVLRYLLIAGALILLIVAVTPLAPTLSKWWMRTDPMPPDGVQAVVPLSGGLNNQGMINAEALDHLITALELVKAGKAPVLVTTTVEHGFPVTGHFTSENDQAQLISLLGGNVEWLRAAIGYTTRDEAVETSKVLFPRGIKKISVVASPLHTRRACAAFEAVGYQVVCVVSRTSVPGGAIVADWPPDRFAAFGNWVYEVLA
ncbi:MAG TPA: YdcF family protein, partial [Gemmatimonadaceae bacterium]